MNFPQSRRRPKRQWSWSRPRSRISRRCNWRYDTRGCCSRRWHIDHPHQERSAPEEKSHQAREGRHGAGEGSERKHGPAGRQTNKLPWMISHTSPSQAQPNYFTTVGSIAPTHPIRPLSTISYFCTACCVLVHHKSKSKAPLLGIRVVDTVGDDCFPQYSFQDCATPLFQEAPSFPPLFFFITAKMIHRTGVIAF